MASVTVTLNGQEISHRNFNREPVVVGSGQASDIVLTGDDIGGQQCRFELIQGKYVVTDLSQKGVMVNRQLMKLAKIYTGDIVAVGKYRLLFVAIGNHSGIPHPVFGTVDHDKTMGGGINKETMLGVGFQEWWVTVEHKGESTVVPIEKLDYTIGSSENCDIVLKGWRIPDEHLVIIKSRRGLRIVNVSNKKTMINGNQMETRALLSADDVVEIGPYSLKVYQG